MNVDMDTMMCRLAARRALVWLNIDGHPLGGMQVTLIAWRPRRRNNSRTFQARIEFPDKARRTVSAADVSPIEATNAR